MRRTALGVPPASTEVPAPAPGDSAEASAGALARRGAVGRMDPSDVGALQRAAGNQAVSSLLQRSPRSDEAAKVWTTSKSAADIHQWLRGIRPAGGAASDTDLKEFLTRTLASDPDACWIALKLQQRGPEPLWDDADLSVRQRMSKRGTVAEPGEIEADLAQSSGLVSKPMPVQAFFFPGKTNERALVIGGVHGSELAGIEVANLLVQQLRARIGKGDPPYFTVVVVPELFPESAALARKHPSTKKKDSNVGREIGSGKDEVHPARDFPKPGQSRGAARAEGKTFLAENEALLELIERFKPSRIASVHSKRFDDAKGPKRGADAPGFFVDPRGGLDKKGAPQTDEGRRDDELDLALADYAEQHGAQVPGNWVGTDKPEVHYANPEHPEGSSLGDWGPVPVQEQGGGAGNREGMTVITVEVRHYFESGGDKARLKELQANATTLEDIFLGPPEAQEQALKARAARRKAKPKPAPTKASAGLQRVPKTFTGTVFLPGSQRAGHVYTLQGNQMLEKGPDGKTVPVANVDETGNIFLLGADGSPAATSSGNVAGLSGSVVRHEGRRAETITATTGSGEFHLEGADGKERILHVKDGGVFAGEGRARKLVGSVDANGNYFVDLDGSKQAGSLRNLEAGKAKVDLKRKAGTKTVRQLEIGQQAVTAGTLYFDDTSYQIRNGQLFREGERKSVGDVTIVKTGTPPEVEAINYRYVDKAGEEQSGDLLEEAFASKEHLLGAVRVGPGAGSTLKIGGRWSVFTEIGWDSPGSFAKGKGFENFGGGNLSAKLRELRDAGSLKVDGADVPLTDADIDMLQGIADVEAGGQIQAVNTWDSAVVTFGFKQWTLQFGELQDLITRVPGQFARYGIRLEGHLTIAGNKVDGISGATPGELRGAYWAEKFFYAGLDTEIIAAEVQKALEDLGRVKGAMAELKKQAVTAGTAWPAALDSPVANKLIGELDNNRPAYVRPVVRRALADATPAMTPKDFVDALVDEIVDEYAKHPGQNGGTEAKARARARRWTGLIVGG